LLWIDKVLRIAAVIIGIIAVPMMFLVSVMAADSGTPQALHSAHRLMDISLGVDVVGILCAFVPPPKLPAPRIQLIGFLLFRIPTYIIPVALLGSIVIALTVG
jgi:hypothetical protein